ncbi:pyridoxamine 5'-phosphate oxidase family protein [Mycobacterium sp.]|uniref:pyridoxamine 5'-phosphate oxidase family protein n=1 Tax=Mycobacterium sp. TaxID=1785 RepID=UPI003A8B23E2
MAAETAKRVDFPRLAATLADYRCAYLITVDDDYRAHTVTVEPMLRGEVFHLGLIGGRTRRNLRRRRDVTLLWPPSEPGGYSLIVDGHVEFPDVGGAASGDGAGDADDGDADENVAAEVVATRAVLHRNADAPMPGKGCVHDCMVLGVAGD